MGLKRIKMKKKIYIYINKNINNIFYLNNIMIFFDLIKFFKLDFKIR